MNSMRKVLLIGHQYIKGMTKSLTMTILTDGSKSNEKRYESKNEDMRNIDTAYNTLVDIYWKFLGEFLKFWARGLSYKYFMNESEALLT